MQIKWNGPSPQTVLSRVAEWYGLVCIDKRSRLRRGTPSNGQPGEAFAKLPEETKEIFRLLKSDDLKSLRFEVWMA